MAEYLICDLIMYSTLNAPFRTRNSNFLVGSGVYGNKQPSAKQYSCFNCYDSYETDLAVANLVCGSLDRKSVV